MIVAPVLPPIGVDGCGALALCSAAQGAGTAVGDAAGAVVGGAAGGAASEVFHTMLGALVSGVAAALAKMLGALFDGAGGVALGSDWLTGALHQMLQVTALLVMPLLVAASIGAIIRQDVGRLARTWLVWLPLAALLTVFVVPLVSAAMSATDAMTAAVGAPERRAVTDALARIMPTVMTFGSGLLAGLIGALVLLGAIAIWLELLLRSAAITVTVFFLPLVLAGLVWPATAPVVRRVVEILVALILSKFVVAAVLALGATAAGTEPLIAMAILLLAAFAPMTLLRLVPLLEAAAIGHLEGRARQPVRAAADVAARARGQLPLAALLMRAGDGRRDGGSDQPGGDGSGDSGADRSQAVIRGPIAGAHVAQPGAAGSAGAQDGAVPPTPMAEGWGPDEEGPAGAAGLASTDRMAVARSFQDHDAAGEVGP